VPNTHIPGSQHSPNALSLAENVIKALSIDNLVFGLDDDDLKILLVKQTDPLHQGKWALPGGWIRYDESLRDAAYRLLEELTGVSDLYLEQLKTFGRVDRFPSERVVTITYYALVSAENFSLVAGQSAADVSWQSVNRLPELVYDHAEIVKHGLKVLRHQVCHQPIGFNLLPEKFTLLQLQALYEAILNTKLDKPNFRRKIMKMNLLSSCNEKQQGVPHRAASLYRFDAEAYTHVVDTIIQHRDKLVKMVREYQPL
jgi:ADP-ribose pyrophosphatase YjhB (NUDIX family)